MVIPPFSVLKVSIPQKSKNINSFWTAIQKPFVFRYLLEYRTLLMTFRKSDKTRSSEELFLLPFGQYNNSTSLWYGNQPKNEITHPCLPDHTFAQNPLFSALRSFSYTQSSALLLPSPGPPPRSFGPPAKFLLLPLWLYHPQSTKSPAQGSIHLSGITSSSTVSLQMI